MNAHQRRVQRRQNNTIAAVRGIPPAFNSQCGYKHAHPNLFPGMKPQEPKAYGNSEIIEAIEREIAQVRATGEQVIGGVRGHYYILTRNKSCQVIVWIDGRRKSKADLLKIANGV